MANRGYLYPSPGISFGRLPEQYYYDSRHTLPIGWFFFYRPSDVMLVGVDAGSSHWQEVKFAAPKEAAVELFRSRRSLLQPYLQPQPLADAAETMVSDLSRWPGEYLLLDPDELIMGWDSDDLRHKSRFEEILRTIESPQATHEQIDAALRQYYEPLSADPDRRLCQILGYTYQWD